MRTAFVVLASSIFLVPTADGRVGLDPVATGLDSPVFVTSRPSDPGFLVVPQLNGLILAVQEGSVLPVPFLDLRGTVSTASDDWGFYGFAFHPDYLENGYFFVSYMTDAGGTPRNDLVRYRVEGDPATAAEADPESASLVLSIPQPWPFHHGGAIAFSPVDGYLYIISGDNDDHYGPNGYAQNLESWYGKLLRIDVDSQSPYAVPPSNPFVGVPGAVPEIWAYGLRNPWRFSFDRSTGDLWLGDVGQWTAEEIDYQPAASGGGENYGWNVFESDRCVAETTAQATCDGLVGSVSMPIYSYGRDIGNSITGGYLYRGTLVPELSGAYLFGDFAQGRVWSLRPGEGGAAPVVEDLTPALDPNEDRMPYLVSFGEDAAGEVYVVSMYGNVYRLSRPLSSDRNGDFHISLSELLRVIQFFNSGGLHCEAGTEDGYAPGPGDETCPHSDQDYKPTDWTVNLSELLRQIQFFNSAGYSYCPGKGTEDNYCPR
ncbi:MAG: PQQ-dependent sugar dehydrogenase [Candidatus Hydrogenedentes bacterium]|nr:PQQ-dependent sugar dehydrogenase [Candidatus Hydrogenedentota bacterium]